MRVRSRPERWRRFLVWAPSWLRPGDLVQVIPPDKILATLDVNGTMDGLPFMPEMIAYCGQRHQIERRAITACYYGPGSRRAFHSDRIVTLRGVRCGGSDHGGCQKACLMFWHEEWLRPATDQKTNGDVNSDADERLRSRLKTSSGPKTYFCQASEILRLTYPVERRERYAKYFSGLKAGNFGWFQMVRSLWTGTALRIRERFSGVYPRGDARPSPVENLDLQSGEWVEVKPLEEIIETLNRRGQNRGLRFSPDMRRLCGRRLRVASRIDRLVVDGTGQMRQLQNTVRLEGSTCGCDYIGLGLGGCARCEVTYWREIWLRRTNPPTEFEPTTSQARS